MRNTAKSILQAAVPLILCLPSSPLLAQRILYVDDDAAGANDGSSWDHAYRYLQDALAVAREAEEPVEVRVAQGRYRPDQYLTANPFAGVARDRRDANSPIEHYAVFALPDGITLSGGYAGIGTIDPNGRDICRYETILTGDIEGNDVQGIDPSGLSPDPSRLDNCHNIVRFDDRQDMVATLDGLLLEGAAEGALLLRGADMPVRDGHYSAFISDCLFRNNLGGAVESHTNANMKFSRCTFTGNRAQDGGAISFSAMATLTLEDCRFVGNRAVGDGGALWCSPGTYLLEVRNCSFEFNRAQCGGAIFCDGPWGALVAVGDSTFYMNSAVSSGGAVHCAGDDVAVADSAFEGNSASEGGAIVVDSCRTTVTNTLLTGNRAGQSGGAILSRQPLSITGCTFCNNDAPEGRALACLGDAQCHDGSRFAISDSILRDASGGISNHAAARLDVMYSNIQGGWTGAGNIDADPCFVAAGCWNANDTPNDANDDVWIAGDYHLRSRAGRWDPTVEEWVRDAADSPCIDAADPYSHYARESWPHGLRANMGAYGNTTQASLSSLPSGSVADLNHDAVVSLRDFARLAQRWQCRGPLVAEDLNRDAQVDCEDLQILAGQWLDERTEVRFTEYWPLVIGTGWSTADVIYDGGHQMEVVDRFLVNDFDVFEMTNWYGTIRGPEKATHYYACVDGALYVTSSRVHLDRLPDLSDGFTFAWPEIIQIGRPFAHVTQGTLTPIHTTLRQLAPLFDSSRTHSILTLFPPEDHARDVLAFVDAYGHIYYAFGRDYGPMLMGGWFMKRYEANR